MHTRVSMARETFARLSRRIAEIEAHEFENAAASLGLEEGAHLTE